MRQSVDYQCGDSPISIIDKNTLGRVTVVWFTQFGFAEIDKEKVFLGVF
ncbi:MAG: hypothetical protein GY705_26085 [Bacteroidetes bacterium]|nr:hypothetical protein [Bacteroidota bacterium]